MSPTKRVLLVAPVAVQGGVERVLVGLVREAAPVGLDLGVVFLRDGPAVTSVAGGHAPVWVPKGRARPGARGLVSLVRGLEAVVEAFDPAVLIAVEPRAHPVVLPFRRGGRKVVWCQHGLPSGSAVDRLIGALPADAVVANSHFTAAATAPLVRRAPVRVVHPGIVLEDVRGGDGAAARRELGIAPGAPMVLMVGRLQPWKGQHLVVDAAQQVLRRHPDCVFVFAGDASMGWEDGDYPEQLRSQAERLGLSEAVRFVGHAQDVAPLLAAADVAVHASSNEPFGLVVVEALAAGVPLVAVAEGGAREIAVHGRDALLVERSSPALAAALTRLLASECLRAALAQAATVRAEQFSAARMTAELRAALEAMT
jgi:glycosyltransferase involved in cell wall biosynthesis